MKTVKYDVAFSENANRWEVVIRFIWAIPTVIIAVLFAVTTIVAWVLQLVYILISGKRHKGLFGWIKKFVSYHSQYQSYNFALTDERSPIIPKD